MDLGISGRTAVVCASTSGLGEATARALAAEGVRTVVSGRRGATAQAIAAELPEAVGVEVDLTATDGPGRLVDAAVAAFGPVDILVLNSGGPPPSVAAEISDEEVLSAVNTLVLAQRRLVSLTLPGMRERAWGRVLAIGSSGVVAPIAGLALSNVGRAALGGYLKTLSAEVAADGVTVNMLLPGRIATARTDAVDRSIAEREGVDVADVAARGAASVPVGRYGRPDEFGAVAAFLCSEAASYVTGTATRCDGGAVPSL
ncbi:SDR family oxidoreductase [Pseudonocardia endophytica]|uniref:3-oxoacyl-[acyl-carrier protein] reductase n=1 Tax=Pseudonocardia endophytica TaxID=401976 RepID=A0A4R1HS31_PSEEN|nr:SDR family oxidoreductase [Pseudonocardia endophytica]TCK22629.1 3-oxoacyl-[acyl-carrier protein] reductase [Pseudonocardia endophytica]